MKKSCSQLTFAQKKEICQFQEQHPHTKHQQIVDEFKRRYFKLTVDQSAISKILKDKKKFLAVEKDIDTEKWF